MDDWTYQHYPSMPASDEIVVTPLDAAPWPPVEHAHGHMVQPAPEEVSALVGSWPEATIEVESLRLLVRLPHATGRAAPSPLFLPARIESSHRQTWEFRASAKRTAPVLAVTRELERITLVWHAELANIATWIWLVGGPDPPIPLFAAYAEIAVGDQWVNCLVSGGGKTAMLGAIYSLAAVRPL